MVAALAAHGFVLREAFFSAGGMVFGFSLALSLMLWLAVMFYWIESLYARLDGLQALAMPAAALCALARKHGGQFLLRIEDTDRERSTPANEAPPPTT